MNDAVITAEGRLNGRGIVCCAMEFNFIGGSMGAVVGEKVTRGIELAIESRQPLVVVSVFGRRAHDGRHDQPDAAGQSFGGAGASWTMPKCRIFPC